MSVGRGWLSFSKNIIRRKIKIYRFKGSLTGELGVKEVDILIRQPVSVETVKEGVETIKTLRHRYLCKSPKVRYLVQQIFNVYSFLWS